VACQAVWGIEEMVEEHQIVEMEEYLPAFDMDD
jgi:hypothetical protein